MSVKKLTKKQKEALSTQAYNRHFSGMGVDIMALSKISNDIDEILFVKTHLTDEEKEKELSLLPEKHKKHIRS